MGGEVSFVKINVQEETTRLTTVGQDLSEGVWKLGNGIMDEIQAKIATLGQLIEKVEQNPSKGIRGSWKDNQNKNSLKGKLKEMQKLKKEFEKINTKLQTIKGTDAREINNLFDGFVHEMQKLEDVDNSVISAERSTQYQAKKAEIDAYRINLNTLIRNIFTRAQNFNKAQKVRIKEIFEEATLERLDFLTFAPKAAYIPTLLRMDEEVTKIEEEKAAIDAVIKDAGPKYTEVMGKITKLSEDLQNLPAKCQDRLRKKLQYQRQNINNFEARYRGSSSGGGEKFREVNEKDAREFLSEVAAVEALEKEYKEIKPIYEKAQEMLGKLIVEKNQGNIKVKQKEVDEYQRRLGTATTVKGFQKIANEIAKKYDAVGLKRVGL